MRELPLTFLALCAIQFAVLGQELKPKKGKILVYNEEYSVLADNKKVRHGDYKKYRIDGSQILTGKLDNNNRVGEWRYYENGELSQIFNYDEMKLIFQKSRQMHILLKRAIKLKYPISTQPQTI